MTDQWTTNPLMTDAPRTHLESPHDAVEIPEVSLVEFLLGDLAAADVDRVALEDGVTGQVLTFGELRDLTDRFAAGLSKTLCPGDVVGLMAPNSVEFAVAILGVIRAGMTITPVNVLSTAEETAHQLQDAGARAVLTVDRLRDVVTQAAAQVGLEAGRVLVLDDTALAQGAVRAFGREDPLVGEPVSDPGQELAVVPYSSGTTGRPKGVMLTHRNLVANICQISGLLGVSGESTLLGVLPFSHIYGMTVVLNLSIRQRAKVITVPRFDLEPCLQLIQDRGITHLFVAPPIVLALAKAEEVDRFDLGSVELLVSGAAPLDEVLASAVSRRLGCPVRQAYGMSEMSPVSHLAPIDTPAAQSSVGWTIANMTCRLLDPASGEVLEIPEHGQSAPGELCCAGPNIMAGYLGRPEATNSTIDADGFLHTGDIATVAADGSVTIVDRLKELIKYKGYQVAPAELEGILLSHPGVADAAVVGVRDPDTGEELPKAYLVAADGQQLTGEQIIQFIAEQVAPYKKIRLVEFIESVPKSASGKILRRELRALEGSVQPSAAWT